MAAEKVTEVSLESIRLLEVKGRTVAAEPISPYVQVVLQSCCRTFPSRTVKLTF